MKVLIVEDDFLVADHLATTFHEAGHCVLGPTESSKAALALLDTAMPDVAILDIALGQDTVHAVAVALRERAVPIIVYTGFDCSHLGDALRGVPYVQKPSDLKCLVHKAEYLMGLSRRGHVVPDPAIAAGLSAVTLENAKLSGREAEVLARLAAGHSNKEIGIQLAIAEGTVKAHVKTILRKIGVRNRTQGAIWALAHGMVRGEARVPAEL